MIPVVPKRSVGLLLFAGLCLTCVQGYAQGSSSTSPPVSFTSAEARIAHNKASGAPRYEGVSVQYAYRVIDDSAWSDAQAMIEAIAPRFIGVLSTEVVARDGHVLLLIGTDGDLENHTAYREVLETFGSSLARHPWTYNLDESR